MSTITCTYDEFKQMSKEFFLAIPHASQESLEAGMKALGLAYLGIQFGDGPLDKLNREVQTPIIMGLATRKMIEREVVLMSEAPAESEPALASRPRG